MRYLLGEGLDAGKKKQECFVFRGRPSDVGFHPYRFGPCIESAHGIEAKDHQSEASIMLMGQLSFSCENGKSILLDGGPDLLH